jgi:MFS family permease
MMRGTRSELRRGWPVVLAASVGFGAVSIHVPALGVMIKPLSVEFGWSRGQITEAMMFLGFTALLYPLVGRLVDRVGARKVALIGIWLYAIALAAIGLSGPKIWTWLLTWAVMAVFYTLVSPVVWTTPVVGRFDRQRGLALGMVLCGNGVCVTLAPTLVVASDRVFGWRITYLILAVTVLVLVVPLTLLFFRDADRPVQVRATAPESAQGGMELGATLRTARFWKLLIALLISGGIAGGMLVHMQPLFTDKGATPLQAAAMVSVMGPSVIFGRLGVGFLLDRISGPVVAAVAMGLPAVCGMLLLGYDGVVWKGVLASGLLGLALGAEVDLLGYLTSRYFGLKNYGAIFSVVQSAITIGYCFTPSLVGFLFDRLGSYQPLVMMAIPLSLLTAATVATLGSYPSWPLTSDHGPTG